MVSNNQESFCLGSPYTTEGPEYMGVFKRDPFFSEIPMVSLLVHTQIGKSNVARRPCLRAHVLLVTVGPR